MGEFFAIGCAISWSVAVILFKKTSASVHPINMNLFKNIFGLVLLIPTGYFMMGELTYPTASDDLLILFLSGFLGIGIADYLALMSLRLIGAGRYAIVECSYSPTIVTLSVLFLGESLSTTDSLGALLIFAAVILVNMPEGKLTKREPTNVLKGTIIGSLGIVLMAIGVVIIKPLFDRVHLMWMIEMRMLAGVAASAVLFAAFKKRPRDLITILFSPDRNLMLAASLFSAYISMIMWVAGFKYIKVASAAILNQTATIFTVLFAAMFLAEPLTPKRVLATIFAFAGVIMIAGH